MMKNRSLICLLLCLLIQSGSVWELSAQQWVSSYRKARSQAIARKQKILIFFSGSDWCMDSRHVKGTLFRSQAFRNLIRDRYVLYNADFPKHKILGQEAREYNQRLANRYGIHHYPAVVLVDPRHGAMLAKHVGIRELRVRDLIAKLEKTASIRRTTPPVKKGSAPR